MICGGEALTYVGKTQFNFNWRFSLLVVTDKIFTRGCINFSVNCVKNTGSICPFSCDKKRTSIIKFCNHNLRLPTRSWLIFMPAGQLDFFTTLLR